MVVIVTYNTLQAASSPADVAALNLVYNLSRCATSFAQVMFVAPIGETCCVPCFKGLESWSLPAARTYLPTAKGSSVVAIGRGTSSAVHVAPEPGPEPALETSLRA